eukprot:scaffold24023_cov221-Skeletonema_marinoi.AAC.5
MPPPLVVFAVVVLLLWLCDDAVIVSFDVWFFIRAFLFLFRAMIFPIGGCPRYDSDYRVISSAIRQLKTCFAPYPERSKAIPPTFCYFGDETELSRCHRNAEGYISQNA